MKFHVQQALRAFMLLAFSAMIANLHWAGELTKFINPKYEGLSKTAAILFFILFLVQVTKLYLFKGSPFMCSNGTSIFRSHHDHGHTAFTRKNDSLPHYHDTNNDRLLRASKNFRCIHR